MFIYFQMLTPSMILVTVTGKGEQKCLVFRMSNDRALHKARRDISEEVGKAIGGVPDKSEIRVHVEHYDTRSSQNLCEGSEHLIFSLGDRDPSDGGQTDNKGEGKK